MFVNHSLKIFDRENYEIVKIIKTKFVQGLQVLSFGSVLLDKKNAEILNDFDEKTCPFLTKIILQTYSSKIE